MAQDCLCQHSKNICAKPTAVQAFTILTIIITFFLFFVLAFASPVYAGVAEWVTNGPSDTIVFSIVISPDYASDKTVFAGTDAGVYRSTNSGQSWTRIGLSGENVRSMAISPDFSSDETLFAGCDDTLYISIDGGDTWDDCSPVTADYSALTISPDFASDQTVFAGTSGSSSYNGLYKSTNGGSSWSSASLSGKNISALAVTSSYGSDSTAFAATSDGYGIYKTTNGTTWVYSGLSGEFIESIAVSPNFASDGTVLADNFISTDDGANWASNGLPVDDIFSMVISPNYASDDTIFAGTYGNGVYKSVNNGATWSTITTDLSNLYVGALEISPSYSTDHALFAGTWGDGVFSCITQSDTWAPTVVTPSPTAGATGVALDKTITITFNEKIAAGSAYSIITLKNSSGTSVAFTKSISGRILTVDPTSNLSYATTYNLIIPAGAVKDTASPTNSFAAQYKLTFATITVPDTTAPTVSSSDPAASATSVASNKTIAITFSETIQAGTTIAYAGITLVGPNKTAITITKSISDAVLSIDPSTDLTYGSQYTLTIPAAAVKDTSSNANALAAAYSLTFKCADTTPPTILSTVPAANSTTMGKDDTMTVTFSETVQAGTAIASITLKDSAGSAVVVKPTFSSADMTLDPSTSLTPGGSYTLTIPPAAVKDTIGNALVAQTTVTFTVSTNTNGPAAPKGLGYSSTDTSIVLSWSAVSDAGLKGYYVYKKLKGDATVTKLNATVQTATSYTDTAVEKGKTYVYYVTAVDSSSKEGTKSSDLEASIGGDKTSSLFKDVPADAWYLEYVETLVGSNVISGYTDGQFRPLNNVTRAEFAKLMCVAMNWELEEPTKASFSDIKTTDWAFQYIETAKKKGVIGGYEDGTFRPASSITRAEIAKIIAGTLKLTEGDVTFKDTAQSWAKTYVNACASAGIISGYPDNTFKPSNPATRAETSKIVASIIGLG